MGVMGGTVPGGLDQAKGPTALARTPDFRVAASPHRSGAEAPTTGPSHFTVPTEAFASRATNLRYKLCSNLVFMKNGYELLYSLRARMVWQVLVRM
jgi:hypothetical protein